MSEEKLTLRKYCEEKGITMERFAKIVDIPPVTLRSMQDNRGYNITVFNARKIYIYTKKHFGKGLNVWDYIDEDLLFKNKNYIKKIN